MNSTTGKMAIKINGNEVKVISDQPFSMHPSWARSGSSSISFFKYGMHSSKLDDLTMKRWALFRTAKAKE